MAELGKATMSHKPFDVAGKRVMVTGASRGIGRAIAVGFAKQGADVCAVARTEPALAELGDEIGRLGQRCVPVVLDLMGNDAARAAVERAAAGLGGLDVIVNNAGVDVEKSAFDLSFEEFEQIMRFNVLTNFALMREAARIFIGQKSGKIINVTSVLSSVAVRDDSAYIASKHGLLGLTRALALEWARDNVQVNALAPGFVETEMTRRDLEDDRVMRAVLRRTPAGRTAKPDEMVGAAIFLASPASDFMTGQTLYVDGGWTVQ
jgi:NAD(P)-dependent dehydrogenase (short-subunit alcohol dehydrogenase family)